MNLRELFAQFAQPPEVPTQEVDDIIGEDMSDALEKAKVYGMVTFTPSTMDALLEYAENGAEDGKDCQCLRCHVLRKWARDIYEGGEEHKMVDILNTHRDVRALLELNKEMESIFGWRQTAYQVAAEQAERFKLPARARFLRKLLELTTEFHLALDELYKEAPVYHKEALNREEFLKPNEPLQTGQPVIRPPGFVEV